MIAMSEPDLRTLIEPLSRIARAAGRAILDIYATDFEVRIKSDSSPVTEADERAERIILPALHEIAPGIPVVSEEHASAHGVPTEQFTHFWLVDPLDGTREFLNRNGEFTVNIALIERDRPVFGVVYVPVDGTTYIGATGFGATRQRDEAAPQAIAARRPPDRGAIVVYSRSHGAESNIREYARDLPDATFRVAGSSVKFCLLAAGEADFYPRFGPTMEWDTAAGQAVLEAAGGRVSAQDGGRLLYHKPEFRNPHFIAQGLSARHEQ
jgi:3'(2'), 5'-bisphosphate nucleotidase